MRIDIAQLFRDAKSQAHGLTGPQRTKWLLEIGVVAIEQTRQSRVVLSQKSPGGPNAAGADGFFSRPSQAAFGIQLPRGGSFLQERETFREELLNLALREQQQ